MKKLFVYLFMTLCMGGMLCTAQTKKPAARTSGSKSTTSKPAASKPKPVAHTAVDLGLPSGTLWATCNVGASTPEGFGNLYSWGEIKTKNSFNMWDYTLYIPAQYKESGGGKDKDGFDIPKKREKISEARMADVGKDIAGTQYDVARQLWGADWQMPTKAQFDELYIACSWEIVKKNDVWGAKITGPNGNWIFMPCAGWSDRSDYRVGLGVRGSYWTSTTNGLLNRDSKAFYWSFVEGAGRNIVGEESAYYGCTVRPVKSTMKQPVAPHIVNNRIIGGFLSKKPGDLQKAVPQQARKTEAERSLQIRAYVDSIMTLSYEDKLKDIQKAEEYMLKMVALELGRNDTIFVAECLQQVSRGYLRCAELRPGEHVDIATIDEAIRINSHVVEMCTSTKAANIAKRAQEQLKNAGHSYINLEHILKLANSAIEILEQKKAWLLGTK